MADGTLSLDQNNIGMFEIEYLNYRMLNFTDDKLGNQRVDRHATTLGKLGAEKNGTGLLKIRIYPSA
jgi:hypothetical protein